MLTMTAPNKRLKRIADYQARKESGRCVHPGCDEPASEDSVRCVAHAADQRKRTRRSLRRTRRALAEAGRCVVCRRKSSTYRCAGCSAREGRIPTVGANNGDNQPPSTPAKWRVDPGTNWNRYRGKAKRGKPPTALLDDQDLDFAVEEILRAKAALAYARSEAVAALPKIQRDGVLAAALGRLDVAERWLDEVRGRHKSRKA